MTPEPHSPSDEERAAQALIAAAGKILAAEHRDISPDFIAALFARAVPEDLMRYDARELAALAADAWTLLAEHRPGTASVRLASPGTSAAHERLKAMSVLEIVNDDMPFLVDSVLGELAERGLEVRLVVHPVFAVARDPDRPPRRRSRERGRRVPARCARASSTSSRAHRRRGAAAARSSRRIDAALADVRVCVQDWRAMLDRGRRARSPRSRPIRRRCRSARSPRRSSSWNG